MISVSGLSKYFGNHPALDGVSFHIEKGEIVGFLGQNGAGKTTLMRVLTTYLLPSSGTVSLFGEDVVLNSLSARRRIGYLPETPPLYLQMSVYEYLKFAAQLKDVPFKQQRLQIDRVLQSCNLSDVKHRTIEELSKGFRQRVGIAQAIINDPDVLILDEPTNGLDPIQIAQFRDLIHHLEFRGVVILSTHILSEIEKLAQRVIILKKGKIIADQKMSELLNQPDYDKMVSIQLKTTDPLAVETVLTQLELKDYDLSVKDGVCQLLVKISEGDVYVELLEKIHELRLPILSIKTSKRSLEDVFLGLMSKDEEKG